MTIEEALALLEKHNIHKGYRIADTHLLLLRHEDGTSEQIGGDMDRL